MRAVARQHRLKHRDLCAKLARAVDQGTEVLRQARAAEGKAWSQIRRGDIQPGVRLEYLHDRVAVDAERLAEPPDLVGESDLERMPRVVSELDHLRRGDAGRHDVAGIRAVDGGSAFQRPRVAGTDHGLRWATVIVDGGPFTKELRREG